MKKLSRIILLGAALSFPALADDTPHANEKMPAGQGPGMMNMMGNQQMKSMHEHMETMQALMTRIENEKDPKQHQNMMSEHMDMMMRGMNMMNENRDMMAQRKECRMGMGKGGDKAGMYPMECMENMQERMNMMQMMMGQMMKHQMESQSRQ